MSQREPSSRLLVYLLMGGLAVWGAYLAIGAYLYNFNPWRPAIVLICVGAFIGGWLLLLRRRTPT